MKTLDALEKRKSVRAFLNKPVEEPLIKKILKAASNAPSGTNTQPWEVAVVTGSKKQEISKKMEDAFRAGIRGKMEYNYYPTEWVEPFKARRKECGLLMYSTLGITREDKQRQADQWAANYRAFDAPVMLLFFMDKIMDTGSFMDYGMFLQSIMLAAVSEGLATCPQAALGEYPDIVRDALGYPMEKTFVCGMAMGYEDETALINSYRTSREPVDSFAQFFR